MERRNYVQEAYGYSTIASTFVTFFFFFEGEEDWAKSGGAQGSLLGLGLELAANQCKRLTPYTFSSSCCFFKFLSFVSVQASGPSETTLS